jgi:hypothetical protein
MAMENDPVIDDFLLFDIVCLLVEWWFSKSQTVSHYQRVDTGPFTSSQDVNGLRRTCGQESPLIPSAIFTLGCHQAWQLEPPCKLRFIAGKIIYTWWIFQCPALFLFWSEKVSSHESLCLSISSMGEVTIAVPFSSQPAGCLPPMPEADGFADEAWPAWRLRARGESWEIASGRAPVPLKKNWDSILHVPFSKLT